MAGGLDTQAALDSVIRQIDTDGDNSIDLTEVTTDPRGGLRL